MAVSVLLALRSWRLVVAVGVLAALALAVAILWPRAGPAEANPLTGVTAVTAGDAHTCALTTAGGVKCWGRNRFGQLGEGTTINRNLPVDVSGLSSSIAAVAAGQFHTCALTTGGGVKCWGENSHGELGAETTELCGVPCSTVPVEVSELNTDVAAVAGGDAYTCAVTTAGAVKCWGAGYGTTPQDVSGLTSGVAAVSAGGFHTCALTTAGAVKCWGDNEFGQLGDGNLPVDSATPVDVSGLANDVAAIASGGWHTCATTAVGGVKCWGLNNQAQLGDGTTTKRTTPVDVSGLTSGVAAISAGGFYTCALTTAGGLKCWGAGFGSTPVDVPELASGVAAVAVGGAHTCVVTTSGGVKCWGNNGFGQLGDGTTVYRAVPVDVVEFDAKPTPTPTPCPGGICPTLTATSTPAPCPVEACMSLLVKDGAVSCTAGTPLEQVCVPLGGGFTLAVNVVKAPEQGYIAVQTYIDYGTELTYKPTGAAADEFVWPDVVLAFRGQRAPGLVNHAGGTTLLPPFQVSTFEGNIVELAFDCSAELSETTIRLLPLGDPVAETEGAGFAVNPMTLVAVPPDSLTLNCVEPPTPTATPTLTPTPRPAELCGDGIDNDGDGLIDSADPDCPLGGSGAFPELPQGGGGSRGPRLGVVMAAVAAAVSALGGLAGAAWYARRRRLVAGR